MQIRDGEIRVPILMGLYARMFGLLRIQILTVALEK